MWLFPQLQGVRGAESREKATIPTSKLAPSLSQQAASLPRLLPSALAPKCCSSWLPATVAPGNVHSGWAAFLGAPSSPAAPLCTPLKGAYASRSQAEGFPAPPNPRAPHPGGGTEGWWLSSCSPPTPSSEAREGRWAGCVAVGTQKASGAGLTHPRASGSHMWVPGLSCTKAGRCSMHTGQTVLSGTVEKRRGSGCLGSSPSSPLSK